MSSVPGILLAVAAVIQGDARPDPQEEILLRAESLLERGRETRNADLLVDAACLRDHQGVREVAIEGDTLVLVERDGTLELLDEAARIRASATQDVRIRRAQRAQRAGSLVRSRACARVVADLPTATPTRRLTGPLELRHPLPADFDRVIILPVAVGERLQISAARHADGEVLVTVLDSRSEQQICMIDLRHGTDLRRGPSCIFVPVTPTYRMRLENQGRFPTVVRLFFR